MEIDNTEEPDRLRQIVATLETERDDLKEEIEEYDQILSRLRDLLTRTANALKGEPGPLVMHDWSDLPVVAATTVAERDRLMQTQDVEDETQSMTLRHTLARIAIFAAPTGEPADQLDIELINVEDILNRVHGVVAHRNRLWRAVETAIDDLRALPSPLPTTLTGTVAYLLAALEPT